MIRQERGLGNMGNYSNTAEIAERLSGIVKAHGEGKGLVPKMGGGWEQREKLQIGETLDSEGYADRENGIIVPLVTKEPRGLSRRNSKGRVTAIKTLAAATVAGLALQLGGCGEKKPEITDTSSGTTPITHPTTSENSTTSKTTLPNTTEATTGTSTTKEKILYSDLVQMSEVDISNLSQERQNSIREKITGSIDSIKLLDVQDVDLAKKISMYFIYSGDNSYLGMSTEDGFEVNNFSIKPELFANRLESQIVLESNGKKYITLKLGGEFNKREDDNSKSYTDRLWPKLAGDNLTEEEVKNIFNQVVGVTITNGEDDIRYSENMQGAISKLIDLTDLRTNYLKDLDKFQVSDDEIGSGIIRKDAFEGLLTDMTFEDALNYTKIPEHIMIPQSYKLNVPQELQDAYRKHNPENSLIYVGPNNRGFELNDALADKPMKLKENPYDFNMNFFGGLKSPSVKDGYFQIIGNFEGLVKLPSSEDVLIKLSNPFSKDPYFVRLNVGEVKGDNITLFGVYDLEEDIQPIYGDKERAANSFLKKHQLREIFQDKDMIYIIASFKMSDDLSGWVINKDENGFTKAAFVINDRLEKAKQLESIFFN